MALFDTSGWRLRPQRPLGFVLRKWSGLLLGVNRLPQERLGAMLRPSPINDLPSSAKGGKPLADVSEASSVRVGPFPRFGGEGSTSAGSSTNRSI